MKAPLYHGRFAPSPTGPLHAGSLVAAVASYLQARQQHGRWYVRIEDIDQPRNQAGAVDSILRSLEAHGLLWDDEPLYQSRRLDFYQAALQQLLEKDLLFYCTCSRKQLREQASQQGIYPGRCRARKIAPQYRQSALRLTVPDQDIEFQDAVMGRQCQNLAREVGDFVVRRADQIFAYQLAVVVDDDWQNISEVVRGADLLDNTARQIYLQRQLGLKQPDYFHIPLVLDAAGEKLGKQTGAQALNNRHAIDNLLRCMVFLGQQLEPQILPEIGSLEEFWQWAIAVWNPALIPKHANWPDQLIIHSSL
jgi:glutamyl-Q tRNA(Asp) synthetase